MADLIFVDKTTQRIVGGTSCQSNAVAYVVPPDNSYVVEGIPPIGDFSHHWYYRNGQVEKGENLHFKPVEVIVKNQRDYLLPETDWTQLPDVNQVTQQSWIPYRQALRDITLQVGYPDNVIWPTKPV